MSDRYVCLCPTNLTGEEEIQQALKCYEQEKSWNKERGLIQDSIEIVVNDEIDHDEPQRVAKRPTGV